MDVEKDAATATVENFDVLGDLFDLAEPQPKYQALLQRGGTCQGR